MMNTASTSPFASLQETTEPWSIWSRTEPVLCLNHRDQTHGRVLLKEDDAFLAEERKLPSSVQRVLPYPNKYKSVLSRLDHACKRTAAFSKWNA